MFVKLLSSRFPLEKKCGDFNQASRLSLRVFVHVCVCNRVSASLWRHLIYWSNETSLPIAIAIRHLCID